MKNVILSATMITMVFFFLMLFTTCADASQWKGYRYNPDRFPSLGLSIGGTGTLGGINDVALPSAVANENRWEKFTLPGFTGQQKSSFGMFHVTLDGRLPVSEHLTLYGAFTYANTVTHFDGIGPLPNQSNQMDLVDGTVGLRWYFH